MWNRQDHLYELEVNIGISTVLYSKKHTSFNMYYFQVNLQNFMLDEKVDYVLVSYIFLKQLH